MLTNLTQPNLSCFQSPSPAGGTRFIYLIVENYLSFQKYVWSKICPVENMSRRKYVLSKKCPSKKCPSIICPSKKCPGAVNTFTYIKVKCQWAKLLLARDFLLPKSSFLSCVLYRQFQIKLRMTELGWKPKAQVYKGLFELHLTLLQTHSIIAGTIAWISLLNKASGE